MVGRAIDVIGPLSPARHYPHTTELLNAIQESL
jgi:hypothetical protein